MQEQGEHAARRVDVVALNASQLGLLGAGLAEYDRVDRF